MKKRLVKTSISALLIFACVFSCCSLSFAVDDYKEGTIKVHNISDEKNVKYKAINVNGELYAPCSDIAEIINFNMTEYDGGVNFTNDCANRIVSVDFDGTIWANNLEFKEDIYEVSGEIYLPLEKMLYLVNAQWCVENGVIYVQLTENTLVDFIDAYCMEILSNNITQTDLLMNGESELSNAVKSSLAAIFNDFDVRVFVPVWGINTLTIEDYQDALLQLAKDELEFVDEYGQAQINDLLQKSDFSEIKSLGDTSKAVLDIPENILKTTDYVNKTYLWIKDVNDGTKKFSKYNDLADFAPAETKALSKELGEVTDVLSVINAIVNINEIATRSKSWNEDFLKQLELLTDFDDTGYNKSMSKNIKKASSSLLEEHSDTFTATTDKFVEEAFKILGEKLVDHTPAGTFTSIITTGLSVAKLFDREFATEVDALELSSMVEWLIRIEHVAFTEMAKEIQNVRTNAVNRGYSLDELTKLRNFTMLSLRTNLRNKVFIYYLNVVRNNDKHWINSDEAKEIENDILWNYVKIIELSESEPLDRLLIIENFDNMYSDEYGCKRDKINGELVLNTETEEALETSTSADESEADERKIYSNDILTVSGILTTENYVINSTNKGTVNILKLDKPIVAELYDEFMGFNGEIQNIDSVQINDSTAGSYIGKNIKVTGTVVFGHTGHHLRTIVLMDCRISEDTADNGNDTDVMSAYEKKLIDIYNNPSKYYEESEFSNIEENRFAINDITGDGTPELIVCFDSTYMSSMVVKVWMYDKSSGEAVQGCVLNESVEFFEDGYVLDNASHNHTHGEAVWPNSVLKIKNHGNGYDVIYSAYSKDESICNQLGVEFPYEDDADGDGIIYYVSLGEAESKPYTEEEYNSVVQQYIPSDKKLDIVYEYVTINNINDIS